MARPVALRIEEQGEGAGAFGEGFDVVGDDGIQVADAVRSGEDDGGVPVGVKESDGFAGSAVFGVEVGKDFRQDAAVEFSELGAFGDFEFGERSFHQVSW